MSKAEQTQTTQARTFEAVLREHGQHRDPIQHARHESVGEFFAVMALHADVDGPFERYEPIESNPWLVTGLAGATVTLREHDGLHALTTYVEGDVQTFSFERVEDARRAAKLWVVGAFEASAA